MSEPFHYYMISFSYSRQRESGFASTRIGWPEQYVNEARIQEAKRSIVPLGSDVVPLSVSYLGYMTPDEFRGATSPAPIEDGEAR